MVRNHNHIYIYICVYRFLRTCDFVVKDVNPFSRIPARPGQTSAQGIAVDTRAWPRWPTRAAGAGWVTRRGKARWVCFTYVHHIYIYYMCVRFTGISKSIVSMVILILCINIYICIYAYTFPYNVFFCWIWWGLMGNRRVHIPSPIHIGYIPILNGPKHVFWFHFFHGIWRVFNMGFLIVSLVWLVFNVFNTSEYALASFKKLQVE